LAIGLSSIAITVLRYDPSIPSFFGIFIINVEFCQWIFLHLLRWHHNFFLDYMYMLLSLLNFSGWIILASLEQNHLDHGTWSL
jgi:hypothetical protein